MMPFDQWFLPDGEKHLPEWMTLAQQRRDGRLTYQIKKYEAALKHCPRRGVAIDIGAHVGLWSFWMAKDFGTLHAFEPKPAHGECWRANMAGVENATLYPIGLGAAPGRIEIVTEPTSSGDSRVGRIADDAPIEMRTLDSFGVEQVDFIKIDCEGFEAF